MVLVATLGHIIQVQNTELELSKTKIEQSISPKPLAPVFPDYTQNYINTIVKPCEEVGGTLDEAHACVLPPPVYEPVYIAPVVTEAPYTAPTAPLTPTSESLVGSIGYALPYGNCVDLARSFGKNQNGNPISWLATTNKPSVGMAALFHYNHVGIVVGIWPNGDLEIAHSNFTGGQHRFNPSEFKGFF